MNTLDEENVHIVYEALKEGKYEVGDRVISLGIYAFNGRATGISPLSNGDLTLKVITLEEEALGGLGFMLMRFYPGGRKLELTAEWESIPTDDPRYAELCEYSQATE